MKTKRIRKNFWIPQNYLQVLETHNDITFSEHVRRALSPYIRMLSQKMESFSKTKKKGGVRDAR